MESSENEANQDLGLAGEIIAERASKEIGKFSFFSLRKLIKYIRRRLR